MSHNSTLFVKNLVFSGVHGSTGRETLDSQRFKLNIEIHLDTEKSAQSDALSDTYDYKNAVEIARQVIEHEHHVLIERISARIADKICADPKVTSTKIYLEKIDSSKNGVPGIVYQQKRYPQEDSAKLLDFNIHSIIDEIVRVGGVSIPILSESYRKLLLEEAETYTYIKQPTIVGPAKVREELSSIAEFKPSSLFFRLKEDFENVFTRKLKDVTPYPFDTRLAFNDMSLQLYEKDSFGISPHMDGSSCVNLICIFVLTGTAKFAICDDREANNPVYLDGTPGNIIIFRSPGFMNSSLRPFHFLSEVTERRIAFGLRQNIKKQK